MKFRYILLPASILITLAGKAQDFHAYAKLGSPQVNHLLSTETRTVIDLSGQWQHIDGGESTGNITIPSSWDGPTSITVRKSIKIDAQTLRSRAWSIQFFGTSDEVELRINGRVGLRHPGGSAPFIINIPERVLTGGTNTIEITVASTSRLTELVGMFQRSARQAHIGILREVFLVGTPHVWTSDIRVTQSLNRGAASAQLHCLATISGAEVDRVSGSENADDAMRHGSIGVTVEAILSRESTGEVVVRSAPVSFNVERARSHTATFDLAVASPMMWTPGQPNLYTLTCRVLLNGTVVDVTTTTIGIRSVRVGTTPGGRRLLLNDSVVFINGVTCIDEYPLVGPSMSYRQMEFDVAQLKTLGVNLVRFLHGSPHPYMLYLCDKYGIMVMAELEAADIPRSLLDEDEIIARIRNRSNLLAAYVGTHPSVIACGLSDGLQENTAETNAFHADVARLIRQRVSTLIYKVVQSSDIDAISEGGFDIIVLSAHTLSHRRDLSQVLQRSSRIIRTAAILTSVGSLVSPSNMNGYSDPLSNEAQAVSIRDGYRTSQQAGIAGCIVHAYNDYRLEFPTMLVDEPMPYTCSYGLVDEWRQPRASYAMLKALINDEKEPLLQAREFDDSTPLVFISTGIILALILSFMANRSRRFREYFLRSILRPYNFYADIRDQRILSYGQSIILSVVISCSVGLVCGALLYFMRTNPSIEYLLHLFFPSDVLYGIVRYMAWRPGISVAIFSACTFFSMQGLAVLLRIGGVFAKGRILFHDTVTIVAWSSIPMLILLPIGVAMYQVLSADAMSLWIPLIIGIMFIWSFLRVLRATSVVFDMPSLLVYGVGFAFVISVAAILIALWALNYEGFYFLQYYNAVVTS
ncbi:MAG: hypothetical protein HYX66_05995 [Ignavibacteria bacterium]|nr:hypothetical protein [Ignavibacteria bacterium]